MLSSIFLTSSTETNEVTYNEDTRLAEINAPDSVSVMTLYLTLFGPVTLRLEVSKEVFSVVVSLESTSEPPILIV